MFDNSEQNNKLAKRIFLNDLNECLYFPKYFEIETVHACNAKCIMCTIKDWPEFSCAVLTDGLFEKFVNEVRNYSGWIETICLSRDGEPTLDKKIAEKVKALKDAKIKKVTLTTNGQLLSSELSESLIDSGLDDIMISIDGITKATYEKIRVGLNYEKVLKNTLALIKLRNEKKSAMTIRIRMVILEENKHEVDQWLDFWTKETSATDRVYAMPAHNWGNQMGLKADKGAYTDDANPCVFLFSSIAMHADGKISLCNVDYNIKYLMGDFSQYSIKEIWNGEKYQTFRQLHCWGRKSEIDLCKGCNLWDRKYLENNKQETR